MQEITVSLNLTVRCERCYTELPAEYDTHRTVLIVKPCETCLAKEYANGREDADIVAKEMP